jgi:hypothetical protein
VKRILTEPGLHYVETPSGLFTATGFWFRTSLSAIDAFAPGLREKEDLKRMILDAETWIKSFEAIGLWSFLISLVFLSVFPSALIAFLLSLGWYFLRSAMLNPSLTPALKLITFDLPILLATLFVISYVGTIGRQADAIIGLALFFVFRFGWLRMLLDKWHDATKPISMNDRILRMMLLRQAMRHDIPIQSVQTMEADLMDAFSKSSLTK